MYERLEINNIKPKLFMNACLHVHVCIYTYSYHKRIGIKPKLFSTVQHIHVLYQLMLSMVTKDPVSSEEASERMKLRRSDELGWLRSIMIGLSQCSQSVPWYVNINLHGQAM